jgi:hypothetical protein
MPRDEFTRFEQSEYIWLLNFSLVFSLHGVQFIKIMMSAMRSTLIYLVFWAISTSALAQNARLQLIHNSPDTDLAVVDVYLNNAIYEDDFVYHQASPFGDVTTVSPVVIGLAAADSDGPEDILMTYEYTLEAASTNVFVICGATNPNYQPIQPLTIYHSDQALEASVNPSATTFSFFNGSMDCGTADLHETELIQLPAFDNVGYGEFSDYLELFTADYELTVYDEPGVNSYASYAAPFAANDWQGQALTIVSSDFINQAANLNGDPLSLWATTAAGGMMTQLPVTSMNLFAQVQFIHNSPDAGIESVDIAVNGNVFMEDLNFRHASSFLNIPAAQEISIEILGQDGMALPNPYSENFTLTAGERYLMIVAGVANPSIYDPALPLEIFTLGGAKLVATNPGEIEFCFVHGSTDSGDLDMNLTSPQLQSLVNNIQYGEIAPYTSIEPGAYQFAITNAGGDVEYELYEADFGQLAGNAFAMLASGFLFPDQNNEGPAMGLWIADADGGALEPLLPVAEEPVFSQIQFIHTSADAALSNIDLVVNGQVFATGLSYAEATGFGEVQVNDAIAIQIFPEGNADPGAMLYSGSVQLESGQHHRLILSGILSVAGYNPAPEFGFMVLPNIQLSAGENNECDIHFYNGSTDLDQIDISELLISEGIWVNDLDYGEFSSVVNVASDGEYAMEVDQADGLFQFGQWSLPLGGLDEDGQSALIFTGGFVNPTNNSNGDELSLFLTLNDGSVYELETYTAVNHAANRHSVGLYPNPAVDFLYVDLNSSLPVSALVISDVTGRVVLERNLPGVMRSREVLDIAMLRNGVYTLTLKKDSGSETQSLLIQH